MLKKILLSLAFSASLCPAAYAAPMSDQEFKDMLTKVLKEDPQILMDVLNENKADLFVTVQAGAEAQRQRQLFEQWENDVLVPKKFEQTGRPAIGAEVGADYTLVAYSDLTCTYCKAASKTIATLLQTHPEIRFVFKSNPSSDIGRHASRWFYEAYRVDPVRAWKLHNAFFERQDEYKDDPMAAVKKIAADCGFDADKMEKDVYAHLSKLDAMIDKDKEEAKNFGFSGTPYFLLNQLVLRGALPLSNFEDAVKFASKYVRKPAS